MYFSEDETRQLNTVIRRLEKNTGIELVAAVVGRCDNYPEIPWKAFALGAAFGSLGILIHAIMRPDWLSVHSALVHIIIVLGVGAVLALLTAVWPAWARCFLDQIRAETEMEQHAQSLFLEREVFATRERTGVLLLVGLFEHRVVILPDSGIGARLPSGAFQSVIDAMTPELKQGNRFKALTRGVTVMEEGLVSAGFQRAADESDQIPDALIQQKGDGE